MSPPTRLQFFDWCGRFDRVGGVVTPPYESLRNCPMIENLKEHEVSIVTVRFATREDIPGIIRLLKQVGRVHHDIRPDLFRSDAQKYDAAALEALLEDPNRPFLVAGESQVKGYAFCILKNVENDPVLRDRWELYLDDLCVDESCRGQGIATALYREVQALARKMGCQAVTLNVWCGNESAMAFYKKLGMKPQKIGMEDRLC